MAKARGLEFEAVVSTPRKLCALENILLYIHQVMATDPPDSKTIAWKLAIGDSFFVEEMTNNLVALGALEVNSPGRPVITELGCQAHRRSEIPSKKRRQKLPLCFDMVAQEFTEQLLFADQDIPDDKESAEDNKVALPLLVPGRRTDAHRIDLDSIRRVAARLDLLARDAVIFDAQPAEVVAEDDQPANPDLIRREVCIGVFLNEHGKIKIKVRDPRSKAATDWFQRVIDNQLKENGIDFPQLLGPLAVKGADEVTGGTDTTNRVCLDGDTGSCGCPSSHIGNEYDDGSGDEPTSAERRLPATGMYKQPEEAFPAMRKVLSHDFERAVFVLDWMEYLVGSPTQQEPAERQLLMVLGKATAEQPAGQAYSDTLKGPTGLLIIITSNLAVLPVSLYQNNPRTKVITIPRPGRPERLTFLTHNQRDLRVRPSRPWP